MAGAWEIQQGKQVLVGILHVDTTTIHWACGLRNLIIPGTIMPIAGQPFDMARNTICQAALVNGFEHCFMLDSDVIPPRDAILRLMAHRKPLISGVYFRRSPPEGVPVMQKGGQWVLKYPRNKLFEVDVCGAGCLLIHRSVLERLPPQRPHAGKHWFDWRVDCAGNEEALKAGPPMSEDFTFCYKPGTWVIGRKPKPIEKVMVGDVVYTHKGRPREVMSVHRRMYSGEMVRLRPDFLHWIESTPRHRHCVLTVREVDADEAFCVADESKRGLAVLAKRVVWLEAGDIRLGDFLFVPKVPKVPKIRERVVLDVRPLLKDETVSVFEDGRIGYRRTRKAALRLHPKIEVDSGFCRLLGYYLAEGFLTKHTLQFAFGEKWKEDADDCIEIMKKAFGATPGVYLGGGTIRIVYSSKLLARLFRSLCETGARNKRFPKFWRKLDRRCLVELVKGHWAGDGWYFRGKFASSTTSVRLARELQTALLRLRILAGVKKRMNLQGPVYTVNVPAQLSQRFSELVGFPITKAETPPRSRRLLETPEGFFMKVMAIEHGSYEGPVYNLSVYGDESYLANGVATHNCIHVKKMLGISVTIDPSVECSHIGYGEAGPGSFRPAQVRA